MTAIAFDGGALASDGRASAGEAILGDNFHKIFRLGGFLVGAAGELGAERWIVAFIASGFRANDELRARFKELDTVFLVVDCESGANSVKRFWSGNLAAVELEPPCAIGSGAAAAQGAMLAGASAMEAVHIAAQIDPFTGGTVRELKVGDQPKGDET